MLEIGPAHAPTFAKRDGFNTRNVDHLDRLGLMEKYRDHNVPTEEIEEVDYVLAPGATMAETIPDRFDLVLAAHVLEHTTSLIHFVNECGRLLTDRGALSLIVPDHRFCFDRFRERSSISAVIDASLDPAKVHTRGTLTEHALYAAKRQGVIAWSPIHQGGYGWVHDVAYAKKLAAEADSGVYHDVHHWVFAPHHLRLLLHDLADLGHISLREAAFRNTVGCEFYLNLTANGPGPGMPRERLLELADAERRSLDVPVFQSTGAAQG